MLMDTRPEADTPEGRKARDTAAALARERGAEAVTESLLPRVLGRSTRTGASITAERVRGMMSSTPVSGLIGALAAMRDRPDSSPLLAELAGVGGPFPLHDLAYGFGDAPLAGPRDASFLGE